MQLIVFFKPETFYSLVKSFGNATFKEIYYSGNKSEYFNDLGNLAHIIQVDDKGYSRVLAFDQSEAEKSSILLVPDKADIDYIPREKFIVLRHDEPPKLLRLGTYADTLCIKIEKQNESEKFKGKDSLYKKLIDFIGNNDGLCFNEFIKKHFTWINPKIIAIDKYLKECLEVKEILDYKNLTDKGLNTTFLKDKEFDGLAGIRDNLLNQCNFTLSNL